MSTYDPDPFVAAGPASACVTGWDGICAAIARSGARVVVVEAYPGVYERDLAELVRRLAPDLAVNAKHAMKPESEIRRLIAADLTDDPVFGVLTALELDDFFDAAKLARMRNEIAAHDGRVVVCGTGAALVASGGSLVYADMPRWELQQRQRRHEVSSIGTDDAADPASAQYKRGYFIDWRVCDRHKRRLWDRMDFVLDTTVPDEPKMVPARTLFTALERTARRPFRVVPYFDPAPWGGRWMQRVCDAGHDKANLGWCFDCVPEENSLRLGFGPHRFEVPAIDLVFREARTLLGEAVHATFGEEFPIRFDFLDTMGGGNLSLQVHPSADYIRERFGMAYTQDESYYLLDADPGATVYLGLREGVDADAMTADLCRAERGACEFPAERYVNRFPARRHDHFLIPAGTVHCSGAGSMVLEISATPYIFTFKLWDWERPGLDGLPRPTHIGHGERSIRWTCDTAYARERLINRVWTVAEGHGWVEERTGLHEEEFIETRRHWFGAPVPHAAAGGVNVLNLVEGSEAVVESPDAAFEPFAVHYAETFVIPAGAGPYVIRPAAGELCGTIKASVRV